MKRLAIFLGAILTFFIYGEDAQNCFIAKENEKILIEEGDIKTPYAPESTFKIALSLMGFDTGIFKNKENPLWKMPEGTDPYINVCKGDKNPRTWMRDSCLWYSRLLTKCLGMEKFQAYVTKFRYGNRDLSGDKDQNNGLSHAWVSSSLKISPEEQVGFIQKMVEKKLCVNQHAYDQTKNIMFIQEMAGGWKLYGKTGNGRQFDQDGRKTDLQHGWFVGYIEKGNRRIVFASHIVDQKKEPVFASFRARNEALINDKLEG